MIQGMFWLVLAYSLSQFYRACLSVFAPVLQSDIGFTPDQASTALGLWFLMFAGMQIPVGWLLDHKSPRIVAASFLTLGAGSGAFVFAVSQGPMGIYLAMMLIGVGCAPVLMTSFYIFARTAPVHLFGTLAGLIVGIGSIGNLAASAPLSISLELIGWRFTAAGLGVITVLVALTLYLFITDPPKLDVKDDKAKGGLKDLLTNWSLYPILAIALVNYAPAAAIRGSWGGSYLAEVYGLSVAEIGRVTGYMALAMILGSLAYGPIDRIIRSFKVIVGAGTASLAVLLVILWLTAGTLPLGATTCLFMAIGFFGTGAGQIMNHGRSLMPAHLTGRGVTLINLFSMGGVGLSQIVTGRIFTASVSEQSMTHEPFAAVFAFLAITVILGVGAYMFARRGTGEYDG
jgi:MFS family permease